MTCNCIALVNDRLRERNTRLKQAFVLSDVTFEPSLMLQVEQIESGRGKPVATSVFATYCPFCGKHYEDKP